MRHSLHKRCHYKTRVIFKSEIYLQLVDAWLSTLRAAELLLALVNRRMSGEKIDGQQLISLSLGRSNCVKSLELDQSSATFSETAIEERCNCYQTVDILRLKFFFVFDQPHSCLHGSLVVLLVKLSLA